MEEVERILKERVEQVEKNLMRDLDRKEQEFENQLKVLGKNNHENEKKMEGFCGYFDKQFE